MTREKGQLGAQVSHVHAGSGEGRHPNRWIVGSLTWLCHWLILRLAPVTFWSQQDN